MKTSWPLYPNELLLTNKEFPTKDKVVICYFPLTGGQFLARVLSCSKNLYGSDFSEEIILNYKKGVNEKSNKIWKKEFEGKYHDNLTAIHPRLYSFKEWLQFNKIIYIDFQLDEKEINWLIFRRNFVNCSSTNDFMADIQFKYEKELIDYLKQNKKDIYIFSHKSFLSQKNFAIQVNDCLNWLNFECINEEIIYKIWNNWWKLNHKIGGKIKFTKPIHFHENLKDER